MRHTSPLSFQMNPPKRSLPATIYTLATALLPFINAIGTDLTRPWIHRDRTVARFNIILQQILALVARMHPAKLGPARFTKLRPRPDSTQQPPQQSPTTPKPPRATPPKTRRRYLSARQVAARLATLLRQLHIAAQETGHPLPKLIRTLCARASTKAGCHALPPKTYKPTGFFASIMTLPPWHPLRL